LRQHVGQVGIDCRPGDGLAAVTPGEVEVAVLAGMGGRRIIRILEADPEVAMQMEALVLQPMQHLDELRVWLAERGLKVCSEAESVERGRRYTVLVVRGGDGSG
jgi:tRNA (adenine22-N1)-methyltransferase